MTYFQALLMGVIQGLTEFLPISSSAHLVLAPWILGFQDPGLTFDVAIHLGTLLAIVFYFWRDWLSLTSGFVRSTFKLNKNLSPEDQKKDAFNRKVFLYLAAATIPGALIGLMVEELAETLFRHPLLIAVNMTVLAIFLFIADHRKSQGKDLQSLTFMDALCIGTSQALALVPGVSRSGVTMTTGLFRGLDRVTAARFSFLLAAPITLGAFALKMDDLIQGAWSVHTLIGIASSAVVGFLSIKYLLKYVRTQSFNIFIGYRIGFTLFIFALYWLRTSP